MKKLLFLFLVSTFSFQVSAQDKQYKVGCIGFYNVENLFDTMDDPYTKDEEFLPEGDRLWTKELYTEKLGNLSKVISEMGTDITPDGVAILGVAEIENRMVLEDLIKQEKLKDRNYKIIHYESSDFRGIDVGLIYQPQYFKVTHSEPLSFKIYGVNGKERFTRDILYVSGLFDGEPLHILVNHWPSRSGGEKASQPGRNAGAQVCKNIVDSLNLIDPNVKIVIMGDLNDDPTSPSVKNILQAKKDKEDVRKGGLFNPMWSMYKKGFGSNAYRDAWSLFDQIIVSNGIINEKGKKYKYFKTTIFNPRYLVQNKGQYKGYPFRTFSGDKYQGGYSDHYPVFFYMVKEL